MVPGNIIGTYVSQFHQKSVLSNILVIVLFLLMHSRMEHDSEWTEEERNAERATSENRLVPARSLACDLGAARCPERFIEISLGQYQLALESEAYKWIDDFRRACRLYLPAEVIERRFPPGPQDCAR